MSRSRRRVGARAELLVFLGYLAVSVAYFGWPLSTHPRSTLLATGPDPAIFVWAFAWWPHALLSWQDPFVTHALYAPSGANLTWITSVPGLAIAFAPLTLLLGPVLSFDAAALLLPSLSAWTAYLLCRALTRSRWAALIGGYLFGFSSFILNQQLQGHLMLTGAFVVPLIALTLLRVARGELSGRGFALRFGLLIALQLSISTEVTLTATLMLLVGLVLAFLLGGAARPVARSLVPVLAEGYAAAALLASPFLVFALLGFPQQSINGGASETDLVSLLVPQPSNALAGSAFPSLQVFLSANESALYLGPPTLLICLLFAWRRGRSVWARWLLAGLAISILLALGPKLYVEGRPEVPLPWRLLEKLPGLDNVFTPRFGEYVSLAAAVIVASWIAETKGRFSSVARVVLPALAVVALIPAAWQPFAVSQPPAPAFFTSKLVRSCFPRGETVAVFPFTSDTNFLQTESNFWFNLAGGYLTPIYEGGRPLLSFDDDPTVALLSFYGDRGLPSTDALLAFAERHDVARVISVVGDGYPTLGELEAVGPVEETGGVYVAPACGRPPLAREPLRPAARLIDREQEQGVEIDWCLGDYNYELPVGLTPGALLRGASRALFVAGQGLVCAAPHGYRLDGEAPPSDGVPSDAYRYYTR